VKKFSEDKKNIVKGFEKATKPILSVIKELSERDLNNPYVIAAYA